MKNTINWIFIYCFITLFINVNVAFEVDHNWMSYIDGAKKINEINIPGTHDSGTLEMKNGIVEEAAKTQSLDITEQLNLGIRYFDLRITALNAYSELYLTHNGWDCYDPDNTKEKLYLSKVITNCINFLNTYYNETIIFHLKREDLPGSIENNYNNEYPKNRYLAQMIAEHTILNTNKVANPKYDTKTMVKDYFYYSKEIPTLEQARNNIVLVTRDEFTYNNNALGVQMEVPYMGKCTEYSNKGGKNDGVICHPVLVRGDTIRIQDDYDLEEDDKWDLVYDVLTNNVPSRNMDEVDYPDNVTYQFYNVTNRDVLTINFMNMARSSFEAHWYHIFTDIFDSSIETMADEVNKKLHEYLNNNFNPNLNKNTPTPVHNMWFILDFPTDMVVRLIYASNDYTKYSSIWDEENAPFLNYFIQLFSKSKRDNNNNINACLQRKIVIDEFGNKTEKIKFNYKCVKNSMNQWYIKSSSKGKYYNIVSKYDGKCLNYDSQKNALSLEDTLYVQKCKKNNKFEEFTIKDGIVCSRVDENKCLDGKYDIHPVILETKRYDNLTCSSRFAKRGYKCCSNQNTKVEYVDNMGNWGVENGELCGIGYSRCSFSAFGYKCCSSVNPEVVYTDELGNWGEEDGEWCGIDEAVYDTSIRIKNRKTGECLITNLHSDTNVVLTGDCNHSIWTYNNENLVLNATGKCLYAMNSQDPRMTDCDEPDKEINHHIHFKLVDNKYICLKNSVDPEICLNGNNRNGNGLKFETSKDEYSEWYLESWNGKVVGSIEEIVRNNSKLRYGKFVPTTSTTTSTPEPTSEPISECYSKEGYPCCSSDISEIVFTDEEGNWGSENNEWCLIVDNSQDIINNTESECPYDGYPCCSSNNSKFYFSDESGIWGYKNTNWGYENGYCIINDDISKYTKVTSYDLCIFDFYGYPCCSSNVTEISMTDDSGTRWGEENGNYCGYYESKSDYKSYWFYHAESNKCLYAPENIFISDKVTLKTCDESDYSKWMTLESRTGFIYSVAYPNYCININSNDEVTLGLCNNYAKISHTDSALFIPTLFEDKCIGLLNDDDINKDSISLRLNTCTNKLSNNFYVWNETDYKQNIMNLGKYNYCSSNISEIVFTDNVGNWGVENGEWCLIKDN